MPVWTSMATSLQERGIQRLASLSEEQLAQLVTWGERQTDVRHLLLRLSEGYDERRVALNEVQVVLNWRQTEAQRILGIASQMRGQLLAALVGLPDEYLGRIPKDGEWTVGQALEHNRAVEERYLSQTLYAVERLHSPKELPLEMPADRLPPLDLVPASPPSLSPFLTRMTELRAQVVAELAGLSKEELSAPSVYGRREVDVRYRMHRFAAHEREHLAQIGKTLIAIGWKPTEAQLLLGYGEISYASLVGQIIGFPKEKAANSPPGSNLPTVEQLFDQSLAEEKALVEIVIAAVS